MIANSPLLPHPASITCIIIASDGKLFLAHHSAFHFIVLHASDRNLGMYLGTRVLINQIRNVNLVAALP